MQLFLKRGVDLNMTYGSIEHPLFHNRVLLMPRHNRSWELLRLLVIKGADLDFQERSLRQTTLHIEARGGDVEMVEFLLDHGAGINKVTSVALTPLHRAIAKKEKKTAIVMLSKGADTEAPDQYGDRPLHLAVSCGHQTLVALLLERGAQVNARIQSGEPPLHKVAKHNREDIEKILRENGAAMEGENKLEISRSLFPYPSSGNFHSIFYISCLDLGFFF